MTRTVELNDGRIVPALAYYNEYDSNAAEWLRNLIKAGLIAPGIVDQRSLLEVTPEDLDGFVQCHFFAGIGIWSYGLRAAGWPDDRPIWTGSCPCQPFSAAGKQKGFDDERHLWPVWFNNLIAKCRPAVVAGEQVASALEWLDIVSHDLEGADYAVGAVDICAAGFAMEGWRETGPSEWLRRAIHDCPDPLVAGQLRDFADWADQSLGGHDGDHIRQRLYWLGVRGDAGCSDAERRAAGLDNPAGTRYQRSIDWAEGNSRDEAWLRLPGERSDIVGLADCRVAAGERNSGTVSGTEAGEHGARVAVDGGLPVGYSDGGPDCGMADSNDQGEGGRRVCRPGEGPSAGTRASCERSEGLRTTQRLADSMQSGRPERRSVPGDGPVTGSSGDSGGLDHHHHQGSQGHPGHGDSRTGRAIEAGPATEAGCVGGMADDDDDECQRSAGNREGVGDSGGDCTMRRLADTPSRNLGAERQLGSGEHGLLAQSSSSSGGGDSGPWTEPVAQLGSNAPDLRRNPVDWLFCRDGKWRPAESGTFPLAHEDPGRVGQLRAFGNALDGECVIAFCTVVGEILDESPETGLDTAAGCLMISDEELA